LRLKDLPDRLFKKIRNQVIPDRDWLPLLKNHSAPWEEAKARADGPRVLIATGTGGHRAVTPVESLLAVSLTLRGARVEFLLCDRILGACLQMVSTDEKVPGEFVARGPAAALCEDCSTRGRACYDPLGLPVRFYGDYLTEEERRECAELANSLPYDKIPSFRLEGAAAGEHALAGALRYFARGTLAGEPQGEAVLRRYFFAALLTVRSIDRLLTEEKYDTAVFHHGIYVPQGLVAEAARKHSLRIVNWNAAYKKKCFIFSHGDTYHHTLMDEPVSAWENLELGRRHEQSLSDYLKSRWTGRLDWIWFHEKPDSEASRLVKETGVDLSKPCVGLLTNVIWDAQLHYPANAFKNMLEWIFETIEYFGQRPELQLLIRIHPAEIRGTPKSRQPMAEELRRRFGKLPQNVFLIPPDSRVSTYAAMERCDSVIIYGTKTGVELAAMGIPVVVAGEAWIRNKGLTRDARTRDEYFKLLDGLPAGRRLSSEELARARKYAFHFFFRRMIPVNALEPRPDWPPYCLGVRDFKSLQKGCDRGLDVICEGILGGQPFIYPAERV